MGSLDPDYSCCKQTLLIRQNSFAEGVTAGKNCQCVPAANCELAAAYPVRTPAAVVGCPHAALASVCAACR